MKRIAFLGNCQLQQIGWMLKHFFELHKLDFEVVWYEPIFALGNLQAPIVPLFDALAKADIVYGQYHEARWGSFSTESLSKNFDIRVVPTLECLASYPQLNPFSIELNYNIYTVDYRFLELYLKGVSCTEAVSVYQDVLINQAVVRDKIDSASKKYKSLNDADKCIFDYSQEFHRELTMNTGCYFTHNHPNNQHLQWLANKMLQDAGSPLLIDLSKMPQILFDSSVPELGGEPSTYYRVRSVDTGLETACKIYYTLFDSYDKKFLNSQFSSSVYSEFL
jgi:hypothetical protein